MQFQVLNTNVNANSLKVIGMPEFEMIMITVIGIGHNIWIWNNQIHCWNQNVIIDKKKLSDNVTSAKHLGVNSERNTHHLIKISSQELKKKSAKV